MGLSHTNVSASSVRSSANSSCSSALLASRADLVQWLRELLPDPYAYSDTSGATYNKETRRLEWAVRPLWAIFSLMAGGSEGAEDLVEPYMRRIHDGLGAGELAFPNPELRTRQIIVEQEVFGYGLLVCGEQLLDELSETERDRLAEWLNMANRVEIPWGSWVVSRLLINAGLEHCGLPYDKDRLAADVRALDSMYSGGGWYENGVPYQRDYYVPLAFHFVSLLIERYEPQVGIKHARERAEKFEDDFVQWFDNQGRSVPFGRSLFYRFGHSCFWAACALTGFHRHSTGEVKHLLLQNLRWWHDKLESQPVPLSPGYGYQSTSLVEDYCAPGSPFRAFRSFVVLALPEDDSFWLDSEVEPTLSPLKAERKPGMLCVGGKHHVYLLSATQFAGPSINQASSKYGKLCYSSAFGWNIPRDLTGLAHFAVDSCLALSVAGLDQYSSRSRCDLGEVRDGCVFTTWRLGNLARVETWLIPIDEVTHVRIHRVEAFSDLDSCEGAFPVFGWNPKWDEPDEKTDDRIMLSRTDTVGCCWSSGICDLASADAEYLASVLEKAGLAKLVEAATWTKRTPGVVLQDPNTNIYSFERNAVPVLQCRLSAGTSWLACLVNGEAGISDGANRR